MRCHTVQPISPFDASNKWQLVVQELLAACSTHHVAVLCAVQVPGQFVGVRLPGQGKGLGDNQQLYSIACSPYESRRDSAYIGGSIIEVRLQRMQQ